MVPRQPATAPASAAPASAAPASAAPASAAPASVKKSSADKPSSIGIQPGTVKKVSPESAATIAVAPRSIPGTDITADDSLAVTNEPGSSTPASRESVSSESASNDSAGVALASDESARGEPSTGNELAGKDLAGKDWTNNDLASTENDSVDLASVENDGAENDVAESASAENTRDDETSEETGGDSPAVNATDALAPNGEAGDVERDSSSASRAVAADPSAFLSVLQQESSSKRRRSPTGAPTPSVERAGARKPSTGRGRPSIRGAENLSAVARWKSSFSAMAPRQRKILLGTTGVVVAALIGGIVWAAFFAGGASNPGNTPSKPARIPTKSRTRPSQRDTSAIDQVPGSQRPPRTAFWIADAIEWS